MEINSKMYDYIIETPVVLKDIIERRKEISKSFIEYYKNINIEQIYILGSGTSYHAGLAAKAYLEEIMNMKIFNMYPTQFEANEKVFNKNTLVIGISQGGQSLSTVAGLDSAKSRGFYTAAVSENPTALVFKHADTSTRIEVGNEKCGAKTKGYSGSIATLMMMLTELAIAKGILAEESAEKYFMRMQKVIANLNRVIEASTEWFGRIKEEFLPAERIIVVGYDNIYANVLEGALKILETVRQGVTGYDIEEFFHGIYNSITDSAHIFYLASQGSYKPRTLKLIEILSQWTPHNYLIASPEGINIPTDKDLICDFVEDKLFSAWEYIIPLQIVACMAPISLGINPEIPKDPQFHRRIGSKQLDGIRDHYASEEKNV
ncbi:SIS domain-containing protein [Petroclostridium sp. X23]|uniref:SIS domain-containing protein n=1 Tax=Petroclostridium sp. X23 TaxID=3045146 RepID=UPI0024ADEB14|nr:SIS domain-containing protein [Petroclostridium sp. X23]WHH57153.1 SIS domain-containing protein [Petroclostridium sp. X23]